MRRIAALTLGVVAASLALAAPLGSVLPWVDAFASFLPVAGFIAIVALVLSWPRNRISLVLATATLAICAWQTAREYTFDVGHATGPGERLVVITHNLLIDNAEPEQTIQALAASDADILLLQEVRGRVGAALPELGRSFPYHSDCGTGCDLAIYSRTVIQRPRWRLRDGNGQAFGPPLMWTMATLPSGRRFMIVALHQPWPFPPGEQAARRRELVAALSRMASPSTIVAGDFNLTPWGAGMAELDRGLPEMRRITRGLFSFPARLHGYAWPLPIMPIDQVFAGEAWRVVSVSRLSRTGSDHLPVRAELRLP